MLAHSAPLLSQAAQAHGGTGEQINAVAAPSRLAFSAVLLQHVMLHRSGAVFQQHYLFRMSQRPNQQVAPTLPQAPATLACTVPAPGVPLPPSTAPFK